MQHTMDPAEPGRVVALPPKSIAPRETPSVALLGAPYVGKSTLFNLLTGLSQRVGSWPGTTVELRTGTHRKGDRSFEIVDLPAVYSLTANSPDEQVARDYISGQRPDVVVVVLNATNLERTLYLVAEALELSSPVVVAINMMDVAARNGIQIEADVLEAALGVPVVAMVASRGDGIPELLDAIGLVVEGKWPLVPKRPELDPQLEEVIARIQTLLGEGLTLSYPSRWLAMKLLEGDREVAELVQARLPAARWQMLHSLLRQNEDAVVAIASARYEWIERMVRAASVRPRRGVVSLTERLDRVATHPLLGPVVLLGLLGLLFWLVYQIADPMVDLLDRGMAAGAILLRDSLVGAPPWVAGLLVDGVLGGVGTVLSLLPILVVFFLGMGILRHVGYLARAAFVSDRFMHHMGLHGESLIPLFLGFGCNVPAVLGARLIDSHRARLLTVLLTPLVPCTGRMAVLVFMAGALFGGSAPLVTWGLVALNLALLALSGVIFDRLIFQGERPALMMELPLYHLPNWRAVALETWQSIREFLVRAGTVILLVSILIWLLANQPGGVIQESYLARVGRYLEPLGGLMGLDWRMMVALLTSSVAKENALATMAVLAAGSGASTLMEALPWMLTPAAALAYLVVQITFIPCASTLSAIHQQTRSWRWTGFTLAYMLVLSLLAGTATYRVASLLGGGA